MSKPFKFGLALSGGGIRGAAHVGVLAALQDLGLKPQIISGVSAGAIVGAFYAAGTPTDEILDFFSQTSIARSVKFNMPRNGGLANTDGYRRYIAAHLRCQTFEELGLPLIINATDLVEGKLEYFRHGNLLDAIVASASVPMLFNPVKLNGKLYVDGGIMSNLPAEVLRPACDFLMGVHVNPILPMHTNGQVGFVDVCERVFHLAVNGSTVKEKAFCDLVVNINSQVSVGMFDISKVHYLYKLGYSSAADALSKFDLSKFGLQANFAGRRF